MIRRIDSSEKGQIMILVLFFLVVAITTTAVLAALWHAEIQMRALEKNSLSAFYLAQAGIEDAKACVKDSSACLSSAVIPLGAGRYNFTVSGAGSTRNLTATGEVLDAGSNVVASRRIEVLVNDVGLITLYQSPDSWKEN